MDTAVTSKIKHYSIFNIDNDSAQFEKISITTKNKIDLLAFLTKVAADTRSSNSTRKCTFKQESKIKIFLDNMLNGDDIDTQFESIASHLAQTEFDSKTNNTGFGSSIKKGSLIITRVQIANQELLLITKIDIEGFFDSKTMELNHGLPEEKGLLKSCLVELDSSKFIEPFSLADSNGKISSFWVNNFIGAEYLRDDQENTELAIRSILSIITPINRISKEDHTELKQNLFSYLKTTKSYVHDEMVEAVIGDYIPTSDKVDTSTLKKKLTNIVKSNKFDGSFNIDKTVVKNKGKATFKFENDIELKLNSADIGNIFHKKIDGKHYVLIKTEVGYERFKQLKSTN
jgi:hypothetical protein